MPFIEADERIIAMDINRYTYFGEGHDYSLSAEDMKRLRDAGVKTVLQQMWWNVVEPSYRKRRDWTPVEIGLERTSSKAG